VARASVVAILLRMPARSFLLMWVETRLMGLAALLPEGMEK
jgi:hypothetical protein